jgi:N6-L-threonylcarbamoyladenine synthase
MAQVNILNAFLIVLLCFYRALHMAVYILGIESSCDDTSAAVLRDDILLSNVIAGQDVHRLFGGVVPELASRAHQQNIIPVIDTAIKKANITKNDLSAVAFTQGPGLLGSLLVGISFAKSFALGLGIPLIEVDHLRAHVLAHFIKGVPPLDPPLGKGGEEIPAIKPLSNGGSPAFPFLCLTVSGGHTQLVLVKAPDDMEIIGQTVDDAAGETFDKAAKIMGLPYPGGPVIDKLAKTGDPKRFLFAKPQIPGLDFSFSGLKTSILYLIRDELKKDPAFIEKNQKDLCASVQSAIVEILIQKLLAATSYTGVTRVALAGGVSANSALRAAITSAGNQKGWEVFIPPFEFTTDNAAMIAMAGYFKYLKGEFGSQGAIPYARSRSGSKHSSSQQHPV